jgi:hypothetical protein
MEMFGTTSVDENEMRNRDVEGYYLDQNWPNPVQEHTQIRFGIPYACQVVLTLHNITGQEVDRFVDSYFLAGEHVIQWNRNQLPPGTYFYRLTASSYSEIRKLIILR